MEQNFCENNYLDISNALEINKQQKIVTSSSLFVFVYIFNKHLNLRSNITSYLPNLIGKSKRKNIHGEDAQVDT